MAKPAARKTAKDKRASARAAGKTAYKYQETRKSRKPAAKKPAAAARKRELREAVEAALDAPLPAHAVEMFKLVRERFPRETDAWLSIYSGGMPWFGRPATEPLKTMDEIARMGVRDFYMDQCCDGVVVTEVTEDTVTAVCDYGS